MSQATWPGASGTSVDVSDGVVTATSFVGALTGNAATASAELAAAWFTHAVPLYVDMAGATYQLTTANCTSEVLLVDANGTGGGTSAQILKLVANADSTGKRLLIINAGDEAVTLQTSAGADLPSDTIVPAHGSCLVVYTAQVGWCRAFKTPAYFASGEVTGTGSSQNTAHGLGVAPTFVIPTITGYTSGAIEVTVGTHTSTNCVFTVTSGVKYRIFAVAI